MQELGLSVDEEVSEVISGKEFQEKMEGIFEEKEEEGHKILAFVDIAAKRRFVEMS